MERFIKLKPTNKESIVDQLKHTYGRKAKIVSLAQQGLIREGFVVVATTTNKIKTISSVIYDPSADYNPPEAVIIDDSGTKTLLETIEHGRKASSTLHIIKKEYILARNYIKPKGEGDESSL